MLKGKLRQGYNKNQQERSGRSDYLKSYSLCLESQENCEEKLFCNTSKHQHQNVVTLQQINNRLKELSKLENENIKKHLNLVGQTIQKFKFIEQFKKKISSLENSIIEEFHMLFEKTEKVIEEEAKNKETLSEMKEDIKNKIPKVKQLANIILNQKEQIILSNQKLKEAEEAFQTSMKNLHNRYLTIKDYCIKMIEVVMTSDEVQDDFEEQQTIEIVMKFYQRHKDYINKKQKNHFEEEKLKIERLDVGIQTDHNQENLVKQKISDLEKTIKKFKKQNDQLYSENLNLKQDFNYCLKTNATKRIIRTPQKKSQNTTLNTERSSRRYY